MELEFLEIDSKNDWFSIFQEIRNESNNYSHISKDAKKSENKNLNRYRDVNPFDHSRVRLQRSERDYINASLVTVASANRSYILTQGPLPTTTGHFWLMVWEQKSKAILMLNRVIEKNAVKCHQYWPTGKIHGCSDDLNLTDVNLKVTFLSEVDESYYIVRKFILTDLESSNTREILQLHYTTWPDFGVPESPSSFLNFLFAVRKFGVLATNVGPPVVHCSAGIGRSGTFCLVDSCLVLIEKNNDLNSVNVREQLLEMRHYRMGLIQTPDQLRFSYLAILKGSKLVLSNYRNSVPLENESIFEPNDNITNGNANVEFQQQSANHLIEVPPPLPPRTILNVANLQLDVSECNCEMEGNNLIPLDMAEINSNLNIKLEEISDESIKLNANDSIIGESDSISLSGRTSRVELRKRARKEREDKTSVIVLNIKKKQKEAEKWDKRRLKSFKRKREKKSKQEKK